MSASFPLGSLVRVSVTFKNSSDVDADPTSVHFTLISPDGVSTDHIYGVGVTIVKDAVGKYHVDIDGTQEGRWNFRFYSPVGDPLQAAGEGLFRIRESVFQ